MKSCSLQLPARVGVDRFRGDICAGDTLIVVSKLADLQTRASKALGTMLITTTETTYTNAATGAVVAVQRGQAIFY